MSPRWTRLLAWSVILPLALALAVLGARVTDVSAQEPVATAAAAPDGSLTPEGTPTPAGTPTPTFTPTITPSPTPTLTGLQARLLLAQTYLAGQDYDSAADLFAEIAGEDRGNVEAVTGLKAALDGKAAQMATMIAPLPTAEPFVAPTVPAPTVAQVTGSRLLDFASVVLAALAALVLLYLLATFIRWALAALRELWYLRVLPALQRPAVRPGLRLGKFTGAPGKAADDAASVVPLVIAGKLSEWNQLVQRVQIPVELHTGPDLGAMGWIKVLWQWLIPQARGYEITGALVEGAGGVHRLAVQRTELSTNRIDRSTTFEHAGEAGEAYRTMAAEAAKWLISPLDIEADRAVAAVHRSSGEGAAVTASAAFDQAIDWLLPVRQQVGQGLIDFADARRRLQRAEAMIGQLPAGSALRAELAAVIADLRRSVPAG